MLCDFQSVSLRRCETNKPPAMRGRIAGYTPKNSKRDTIKVFKPNVKRKEQNMAQKVQRNQSQVLIVPAKYTSQRCPKCGQIRKENRNHDLHEYKCTSCGFRTNDDRVGAMNLQELGKQYVSGIEKPKFKLNNVTD